MVDRRKPARGGRPPSVDVYPDVSTATRLVGDRWSLLVVRELALGGERFNDIHDALPGLSRTLLASRLRYLERLGIVERRQSSTTDRRSRHTYGLTAIGWGLIPVLRTMDEWAKSWQQLVGTAAIVLLLDQIRAGVDAAAVPRGRIDIQFRLLDSTAPDISLRVDSRGAQAWVGRQDSPDLIVHSSPRTLDDLYWGRRTCGHARDHEDIVFDGPSPYAQEFPQWFPHRPAVTGQTAATLRLG